MAGLMPTAATPPVEETMPAQPQNEMQGEPADPESQAMYEEWVARGILLIFDAKQGLRPGIRQMLESGGDDPATALGQAAGLVIARVDEAAANDGVEVDGDLRDQASAEIFEVLADAATQAGIYDFENDDAAFQKAFLIAADTWRQQAQESGRIDPEKAKMDLEELGAADRDGRLDQIMQGLGEEEQPAPQPGGVA